MPEPEPPLPPARPTRLFVNAAEAADYLRERSGARFSAATVKRRRRDGDLVGYRIGRDQVFKIADLDAFLAAATGQAARDVA